MNVYYHTAEFVEVSEMQKEYFKKNTSHVFTTDGMKEYKRLFDLLAGLILHDYDPVQKSFEECSPQMLDILTFADFPKKYFKECITHLRFLCEKIQDSGFGKCYDGEYLSESPFALFSNIRHLIVITAYQLKL